MDQIETTWREQMKAEEKPRSIVNLHMIPRISEKLSEEVHFVIAGFTNAGMAHSLKILNSMINF